MMSTAGGVCWAGRGTSVRPETKLVAEAGANGNALAASGTTAAENGGAALGLHARTEAVLLYAAVAVRLKCALRHGNALLSANEKSRRDGKY
jgi:hypothetical protein